MKIIKFINLKNAINSGCVESIEAYIEVLGNRLKASYSREGNLKTDMSLPNKEYIELYKLLKEKIILRQRIVNNTIKFKNMLNIY